MFWHCFASKRKTISNEENIQKNLKKRLPKLFLLAVIARSVYNTRIYCQWSYAHIIITFRMATGMMIVKNNPNVSNWNLERDYLEPFCHEYEYPHRSVNSSIMPCFDGAFGIFISDCEYSCNGHYQGFNLIFNIPGKAIAMSQHFFRVPIHENTPKIITTSEALRHYEPSQRQCFYQSERQLRFFKMYTQHNCEEEYRANLSKSQCDCVKFSMLSKNFLFI